jgi:DNA-binding MurR/RpiR family transcriptional regulator
MGVLTPEASIAERLRRASHGFAPAQRRVVRALLTEYPLTGLEPLAIVAARAGTSGPTVLRVVGKLGFTDHLLSPLAGDAHVVIVTATDTGTPFSVMSPALAAVETVLVSVVDRLGGAPQARMERYDELSTEVLHE